MPYVIQKKRKEIAPHIKDLLGYIQSIEELKGGDVNYIVTLIIKEYYKRNKRYEQAESIMGALTHARGEFKRRVVDKYEDKKILENGDVYHDI